MKPVATTSGAWANSAATNEGLINNLIASKYITSDVLADAMRDQHYFIIRNFRNFNFLKC